MTEINGETKTLALFGRDLSYSLSPSLHNGWIQKSKINACYLPFEFSSDDSFVSFVKAALNSNSFLGANVTNPFKGTICKIDEIVVDDRVAKIGASNTLFRNGNQWKLTNTDVDGIDATLQSFLKTKNSSHTLILGAGGAAAAAAFTCLEMAGSRTTTILCRKADMAQPYLKAQHSQKKVTIQEFGEKHFPNILPTNKPCLLINTLPLGHKNEMNPFAKEALEAISSSQLTNSLYFDMIYRDTPAINLARSLGLAAVNGETMLHTQAEKSFVIWKDSLQPAQA